MFLLIKQVAVVESQVRSWRVCSEGKDRGKNRSWKKGSIWWGQGKERCGQEANYELCKSLTRGLLTKGFSTTL